MFNSTGNQNLKFSMGAAPSNTAPFNAPTQGQIGSGVDPMMLMQLMSMMSGDKKKKEGNDLMNDKYQYAPPQIDLPNFSNPYQMAAMGGR